MQTSNPTGRDAPLLAFFLQPSCIFNLGEQGESFPEDPRH